MADDADKRTQDLKARLGLLDPKRASGAAAADDTRDGVGAAAGETAGGPELDSPADDEGEGGGLASGSEDSASRAARASGPLSSADMADMTAPRAARGPLIAIVVVIALAFAGGGYFVGDVFGTRKVENARVADAKTLLEYVKTHTDPQTGENTLEVVANHKAAVEAFAVKVREAKAKGDLIGIQADLFDFLRQCQGFQITFDLEGAMKAPFFAGDLVPHISRLSASLARFQAATSAVAKDAGLVAYVIGRQAERGKTPGDSTRKYLLDTEDIDGVSWGAGRLVARMQEPEQIVDEETGEASGHQVAVLPAGEEKGKLVKTTEIILVNIEADIRELEGEVQQFALGRVLDRVLELADVAKFVNPQPIVEEIEKVASKPTYFTF